MLGHQGLLMTTGLWVPNSSEKNKKKGEGDGGKFPGSSVVKILCFHRILGGVNSIPHQRTKIPHAPWPQAPKKKATQRKSGSGYPTVQSSKLESEYLFWVTKGFYQLPMESVTSISKLTLFNLKTLGGLPWWLSGKESTCQYRKHGTIPSPGESHMPQSN